MVLEKYVIPTAKIELEVIVAEIRHLNEGINKLEQEIEDKCPELHGYENITSIKGIGNVSVPFF